MKRLTFIIAVLLSAMTTSAQELRISFLGDSYTTFEGKVSPSYNAVWYYEGGKRDNNDVTSVEQTWWHLVATELGAKIEKNNSWSGSTICCHGYRNEDYSDRAFVTRTYNLGNPDLILVCGGTNDSWAGSPIGEYKYEGFTAEDLYSFRPAMACMLRDLKTLYPKARVIFILNSELKEEINESVHTLCTLYNVECVDLHDIDKGSSHPSVAGMKAFAEQVLDVINHN